MSDGYAHIYLIFIQILILFNYIPLCTFFLVSYLFIYAPIYIIYICLFTLFLLINRCQMVMHILYSFHRRDVRYFLQIFTDTYSNRYLFILFYFVFTD